MKNLNEEHKSEIIKLIKEGAKLPSKYKEALFPPEQKEYELVYDGKEREEDILSDTMAVPLQPVKTFGKPESDWTNKLIFGDNLQILKELMNDPEVKGKVRLIYIDPPFGTGDIYDAKGDAPAYSAKLQGVKYIEFVRKRLVFLKEMLANDGGIFIRIDYHFGHYIKAIMDELFEKNNFRNEIVVNRGQSKAGFFKQFEQINSLGVAYDTLFWYSKNAETRFSKVLKEAPKEDKENGKWMNLIKAKAYQRPTMTYEIMGIKKDAPWMWRKERSFKAIDNFNIFLKISKDTGESLEKYWIRTGKELEFVRKNVNQIQYWIPPRDKLLVDNNWLDIKGYSHITNYPTENSEELLERVIQLTDKDDIVLDCFAGSGTTAAIAEKLGRRWIAVDCGKLSIYTIQKRLLNLKSEIGNSGKSLKPKPFTIYNAGLYDYRIIKELSWEQYRDFALRLFQCRDEKHEISGLEIDGYYGSYHTLVFNFKKSKGKDIVLDRGYIDDLHKIVGKKVSKRFFIIVPAANVNFFETTIEKNGIKYYILTIPYSIINELHEKNFTSIKQPVSEMDVNNTVDAVGFDFVVSPEVECTYSIKKAGAKDLFKNAVIKIKKFKSNPISKEPNKDYGLDTLSMVMIDYDYDDEVFDLDEVFYAENIKKDSYEIQFDVSKIKNKCMIIYIDIFGNEKREIKQVKDFK